MKEAKDRIIKVTGTHTIDKIVKSKSGDTIRPKIFKQEHRDPRGEGVFEEEYEGRPFMGTKRFLSPTYNDIKNRWNWGGTTSDLSRLIGLMNLRYPKKHPKAGQLIEPGNVDARLTDMLDPVFTHPDFYMKYFLSDGRASLNLSDPRQEFIYLASRSSSKVIDRTGSTKKISNAKASGADYELITVGKINQNKKDSMDSKVAAIKYLSTMSNDEEKMHKICEILNVPGYSRNTTDSSGLFVLLMENVVENEEKHPKFRSSWQKKFIELAESNQEELGYVYAITRGFKKGIIRQKPGYFSFAGERIDVSDRTELEKFFMNPDNQDKYLELEGRLAEGN